MDPPRVLCADEWKPHVRRISVAVPEICWRSSVIKAFHESWLYGRGQMDTAPLEDVDKDALSLCT